MRVLVTGASGNVGRAVVAGLAAAGVSVHALYRRPVEPPPGVTAVRGDLRWPDMLRAAGEDVDAVFLLWPLHTGVPFAAALRAIDRPVVFLGTGGVPDLPFARQERLLRDSGRPWTMIEPSTFAVNALWWAAQVRAGDEVRGAFGDLALPMLHEDDIAAVAVRALLDGGHAGRRYRLTGPAYVSQAEQVAAIGAAVRRPVRWREVGVDEARPALVAGGVPESFVDLLLTVQARLRSGPPAPLTDTVREVTGRPARTFARWAADHAAEFTPAASHAGNKSSRARNVRAAAQKHRAT